MFGGKYIMNNKEFLKSIYEVVNMGYHSCNKLLEDLEGKDNKIISVIEEMKKKYCSFQKDTKKLDKKYKTELEDLGLMAKMGSSMEMKMEVMKDNSDSKIADMLIRGNTMGVVEIEKGIHKYEEKADKDVLKLAKEVLSFQKENIENLKEYL